MIDFLKYHGAGNDFVILDQRRQTLSEPLGELSVQLCHRRFGVGADGILVVRDTDVQGAQAAMHIYNSDGSVAEMCGNGLRCVVKYLLDEAPDQENITVATGAGPLQCVVQRDVHGRVQRVRVDMGKPILDRAAIPISGEGRAVREGITHPEGGRFLFTGVSLGNPHAVIFADSGEPVSLARRFGPSLEAHPRFPKRANISFVRQHETHLEAAVWERGAGLTAACGTGACAIGVAAVLEERVRSGEAVTVSLPGGELEIEVAQGMERVFMTGPASLVFSGRLDPASLMSIERCQRLSEVMGAS
ncbi:MAG: diaminopimelate epimerase [Polyangia bacterium]|jgi:diaminopimelate epimerase|nr:diaminopimelate epimerase [Polyangia bacterium]